MTNPTEYVRTEDYIHQLSELGDIKHHGLLVTVTRNSELKKRIKRISSRVAWNTDFNQDQLDTIINYIKDEFGYLKLSRQERRGIEMNGGKTMAKTDIWKTGKNYLIRTVTMIYTGKLTKVTDKELVIIDASWIPETERWADSVKEGKFREVEPYPDGEVIIGRGGILDACVVSWKVPRIQK